jgi:hypothetical protein
MNTRKKYRIILRFEVLSQDKNAKALLRLLSIKAARQVLFFFRRFRNPSVEVVEL